MGGKRCAFILTIATFVILTLAIIFFIIYTGSESVCTSKECVKSANELMTHLEQSVSPCHDFYEFTCANFARASNGGRQPQGFQDFESHQRQQHQHQQQQQQRFEGTDYDVVSTWDEDRDYLQQSKSNQIRHMIEEEGSRHDTKTLSQIKSFYRSCGNETGITKDEIKGLLRDIGGWPTLERGNWRENRFDWKRATHHLRKLGLDVELFIVLDIDINKHDPTKHILSIRPGWDYWEGARINTEGDKKLFVEYMVEVGAYFGADRIRAERDSKEIMEFLWQLRKIFSDDVIRAAASAATGKNSGSYGSYGSWRNERRRYNDDTTTLYNPMSIAQLQKELSALQWLDYINGVLRPSTSMTSDETVGVPRPKELKLLLDLLARTPKKILANFVSWKVIQSYVNFLPDSFHAKCAKFRGVYRYRERRDACAQLMRNIMSEAVETCYVRRYVSDEARRLTKEIIDNIKREFVRVIDEIDWLDADVKQVSREKLASIKDYVAYTQEAPGLSRSQIYNQMDFDESDFFRNLVLVQLLNANLKYKQLNEPVVDNRYDRVEYNVIENILVLPSDFLQGSYLDVGRPMYMNYGTIGTLIAYQLSNLFLEGRRYDLYGNLREWSSSQSLYNYDTKAKCLSKQYKDFVIPGFGKNLNSSKTKDDDFATMFGLLMSYRTYSNWADKHDTESRLPGLTSYSPRQVFWVSAAIGECLQKWHPDGHRSHTRLRVAGPLRNLEEFSRDFGCPINSFMNPENKCTLWTY